MRPSRRNFRAGYPKTNIIFENSRQAVLIKADKEGGRILIDSETTLSGIPAVAWDYRLGNRSALEWIVDQYKESAPKDPTIRERFNTYRFADYKEQVITLLARVTTVAMETQRIIEDENSFQISAHLHVTTVSDIHVTALRRVLHVGKRPEADIAGLFAISDPSGDCEPT